jgi:hypothetical protein
MFDLMWTEEAIKAYKNLEKQAFKGKTKIRKKKSSKQEGLFKQIKKTVKYLRENPRHPGLETHIFSSLNHPWDKKQKVFEAYAQNNIAGAYRIFWCYGPNKKQIIIISITAHP